MAVSFSRSSNSKSKELEDAQSKARNLIDKTIGEVRLKFITDLPGQETVYKQKEQEAITYLALDPEPATLEGFPRLVREVGITAPTALELAQLWIFMAEQWNAIDYDLEQLRVGYKTTVTEATSIAVIDAAVVEFLGVIDNL